MTPAAAGHQGVALDLDEVMRWVNFAYPLSARGLLHVCAAGNWSGRPVARGDKDWHPDQLTSYVHQQDRRGAQGIYLAGCTLRPAAADRIAAGGRGGAQDAHYAVGLWSDIDFGTVGHKGETLPPNEAGAALVVSRAGLVEPTAWIHSGGGLYGWWLLERPIRVTKEFAGLMVEWQAALGRGAEQLGYSYGTGVGDLARVLRLPGTVNRKVADNPRQCRILSTDGPRYELADLLATADRVRPAKPAPAPVTPRSTFTGTGSTRTRSPGEVSPLDDFEARTSWDELIELAGGTFGKVGGSGERQWVRPGKTLTEGISATTGYDAGRDRFKVFTDAWPPFVQGEVYTKPGFLAALQFRGDHSALARHLAAQGYGSRQTITTDGSGPVAVDRIDTTTGPAEWGTPVPVDEIDRTPLPDGEGRYPGVLWAFVDAVAVSLQVPRDMVFLLVLSILSTASGGRWHARIGADWSEPLSLMTVTSLPSGSRKSATVHTVAAPLYAVEAELRSTIGPLAAEQQTLKDLAAAHVEQLKRQAAKSGTDPAALLEAVLDVDKIDVPAVPRLLADDITPEKMGVIMHEQGGRLGVISAEGGLFAILSGRYSSGSPNLDLVLKSHAGDPARVDRIGRPSILIDRPFLAVGVTVQPEIIEGLSETSLLRGAGLLARFLYAIPRSLVGRRVLDPDPVPPAVAGGYSTRVRALAGLAWRRDDETAELRLSGGALAALRAFRAELEPKLDPYSGALAEIGDWASKLPGQLVRIAALFALFVDPTATEVSEVAMVEALGLADYLTNQAIGAFEAINGRQARAARPRAVLAWLRRKGLREFTVRQARRDLGGQAWAQDVEVLRDVLDELEDFGWIRRQAESGPPRVGRPPSERYEVNPAAFAAARPASSVNFVNATPPLPTGTRPATGDDQGEWAA